MTTPFCGCENHLGIGRIFHGHEAVSADNSINSEDTDSENLEASAAIFMFQEFDPAKAQEFHMHGETSELL